MNERTLVIVGQSHPYGAFSDFLEEELPHHAAAFDRVIIVPVAARGERQNVPSNVEVDLSVSERLASRARRMKASLRHAGGRRHLREELRRHRTPLRHPESLAHLLTAAGTAAEIERWFTARRLPPSVIAHTVWLGAAAVGASAAGVLTVSRAHRGDLYEQFAPHGYLPLQRRAIEGCAMVAAVSDEGAAHLRRRHPQLADRIVVRRLGISGSSVLNPGSTDGVLRVVSCSALVPVKRPEFLVRSVAALAALGVPVEWHHFGSGPLQGMVEAEVGTTLRQVDVVLHGAVPNREVLAHYETHPVDALLNTSSSEGVPVSMMEAASAGIPIVAPAVGGIPEIVDDVTGRLFPVDAEPRAVAELLAEVATWREARRRDAIRTRWHERYSADVNYPAYAQELLELSARRSR